MEETSDCVSIAMLARFGSLRLPPRPIRVLSHTQRITRRYIPRSSYCTSTSDDTEKQSLSKLFDTFLAKRERGEQQDQPSTLASFFKDKTAVQTEETPADSTGTSLLKSFFEKSSPTEQGKQSLLDVLYPTKTQRLTLRDLKYLPLYPAPVRRWIIDAKTPRGYYDPEGVWTPIDTRLDAAFLEAEEKHRKEVTEVPMHFRKEEELPEDLKNAYRFDIEPDEVEHLSPKVKEILSMKYANKAEILRYRIKQIVKRWGTHDGDTGNTAVQVAVLTLKIRSLRLHCKMNKKDKHNAYALQRYINRRHFLMKYLKRKDAATYYKVLKVYNLRDTA